MSLNEAFGETVRSARLYLKLSQTVFAANCGIDRTYLSDIEHGKHTIGIDIVQRIAERVGFAIFMSNMIAIYSGKTAKWAGTGKVKKMGWVADV